MRDDFVDDGRPGVLFELRDAPHRHVRRRRRGVGVSFGPCLLRSAVDDHLRGRHGRRERRGGDVLVRRHARRSHRDPGEDGAEDRSAPPAMASATRAAGLPPNRRNGSGSEENPPRRAPALLLSGDGDAMAGVERDIDAACGVSTSAWGSPRTPRPPARDAGLPGRVTAQWQGRWPCRRAAFWAADPPLPFGLSGRRARAQTESSGGAAARLDGKRFSQVKSRPAHVRVRASQMRCRSRDNLPLPARRTVVVAWQCGPSSVEAQAAARRGRAGAPWTSTRSNCCSSGASTTRSASSRRRSRCCGRCSSTNDRLADVHDMLGVICHSRGNFAQAEHHFERALAINPSYTEAALNLAVTYNDRGKYEAARQVYARIEGAPGGTLPGSIRSRAARSRTCTPRSAQAYADAGLAARGDHRIREGGSPLPAVRRPPHEARHAPARGQRPAARARAVRGRGRRAPELRAGAHPARRHAAVARRERRRPREQWRKVLEIEPGQRAREDVPAHGDGRRCGDARSARSATAASRRDGRQHAPASSPRGSTIDSARRRRARSTPRRSRATSSTRRRGDRRAPLERRDAVVARCRTAR